MGLTSVLFRMSSWRVWLASESLGAFMMDTCTSVRSLMEVLKLCSSKVPMGELVKRLLTTVA